MEKTAPKYERTDTENLPCGHTRSQASWLGCTEDGECRPIDHKISEQYAAEHNRGR